MTQEQRSRWGRRGALAAAAATAGVLVWRRMVRPEAALTGKVVLITGGSRGLGLLLAREFVRRGARDIAICDRDDAELEAARRDLEARGARVFARRCDVGDRDRIEAWVRATAERFGGIDVVVNNASVIPVGPFAAMRLEDFARAMDVSFWGTVHVTLASLPFLRRRGDGRIVNITSIGATFSIPHLLPYNAARFATLGFSEGIRAELAREGITVTTIVPGLMRTGSPVNARFQGRQTAEFTWFSLGDALPFTSMDAERAARRIVDAALRGKALPSVRRTPPAVADACAQDRTWLRSAAIVRYLDLPLALAAIAVHRFRPRRHLPPAPVY